MLHSIIQLGSNAIVRLAYLSGKTSCSITGPQRPLCSRTSSPLPQATPRVFCGQRGPLWDSYTPKAPPHRSLGRTPRFPTLLQVISRSLCTARPEQGNLSKHQASKLSLQKIWRPKLGSVCLLLRRSVFLTSLLTIAVPPTSLRY